MGQGEKVEKLRVENRDWVRESHPRNLFHKSLYESGQSSFFFFFQPPLFHAEVLPSIPISNYS